MDSYSSEHGSGAVEEDWEISDPILALRGLGKEIWGDEHPDDYVRRLREGWSSEAEVDLA